VSSDQIRALRQRLGLTQAEFADRYHINRRVLQHWEQGRYRTSDSGVTLLTLIDREPELIAEILSRP
jgi:putative transcriptional regulator